MSKTFGGFFFGEDKPGIIVVAYQSCNCGNPGGYNNDHDVLISFRPFSLNCDIFMMIVVVIQLSNWRRAVKTCSM